MSDYENIEVNLTEEEKFELMKMYLKKHINNISYDLFLESTQTLEKTIEQAVYDALLNQILTDVISKILEEYVETDKHVE